MSPEEYNRPVTWRAYYESDNGVVYSDSEERSMAQVALALENDVEADALDVEKAQKYLRNYDVTYNYNFKEDGEWKTETQSLRYGSTLEAPEAPTREDYDFGGWDYDFANDSVVLGKVTANAKWTLKDGVTLSFDGFKNAVSYEACSADYLVGVDTDSEGNYLYVKTGTQWQDALVVNYDNVYLPAGSKITLRLNMNATWIKVFINDSSVANEFQVVNKGAWADYQITLTEDTNLQKIKIHGEAEEIGVSKIDIPTSGRFNGFEEAIAYTSDYSALIKEDGEEGSYLSVETGTSWVDALTVHYNDYYLPAGVNVTLRINANAGWILVKINGNATPIKEFQVTNKGAWADYTFAVSQATVLEKITVHSEDSELRISKIDIKMGNFEKFYGAEYYTTNYTDSIQTDANEGDYVYVETGAAWAYPITICYDSVRLPQAAKITFRLKVETAGWMQFYFNDAGENSAFMEYNVTTPSEWVNVEYTVAALTDVSKIRIRMQQTAIAISEIKMQTVLSVEGGENPVAYTDFAFYIQNSYMAKDEVEGRYARTITKLAYSQQFLRYAYDSIELKAGSTITLRVRLAASVNGVNVYLNGANSSDSTIYSNDWIGNNNGEWQTVTLTLNQDITLTEISFYRWADTENQIVLDLASITITPAVTE